jgi:hypothetical protein
VFHFEGKLWRTLPLLAWRPGELTRRYIDGERARFVSPMAIFLFSIFAMFAVFSFAGIAPPTDMRGVNNLSVGSRLDQGRARRCREKARESDREARRQGYRTPPIGPRRLRTCGRRRYAAEGARHRRESISRKIRSTVKIGAYRLVHARSRHSRSGSKNPSLMVYKLQSSIYKFSWLLIPLSLPFLWLLFFWKREYKLYDHAIFITYSIAFMSLLFIVITLASKLGVPTKLAGRGRHVDPIRPHHPAAAAGLSIALVVGVAARVRADALHHDRDPRVLPADPRGRWA